MAPDNTMAVGVLPRIERSAYRGGGTRYDFLPLYLYEGELAYLHTYSVGLKFRAAQAWRFDVFLKHRFEGYPVEDIPASLVGMARREQGIDAGMSAQWRGSWGVGYVEALHDVSAASRGSELRVGYKYPWRSGRWLVRPHVMLGARSARLDNYYYGVRADEATPERPAYDAGRGTTAELGVYALYQLTERWRLLAGATVTRLPATVGASPVVEHRTIGTLSLGAMYDLSPTHAVWEKGKPLIVRAFYGASSDCNVMQIAELRCTSTHEKDKTGIVGVEVGRPFIKQLNGWPVDIAGFVGLIRHNEDGNQPDFWQINAYFKGYYYGFPWDARVRTRIGWGVGLSYARRVPFVEQRDQAERGRVTSKLLNTFDPTVDINIGDLLRRKRLRETYAGVGVSHRSGIFGTSQVLGNVNGGSNFIYGYVETSF